MKKSQQEQLKKRLPITLILLVAAVVLGFFLRDFVGPTTKMWQRGVFCVASPGTALGAVFFFLSGWLGLPGAWGLVLLLFLPRALPDPWNRYFSLVYLVLLFTAPYLIKRWRKKKEQTGEDNKEAEEDIEEETPEEIEKLLQSASADGIFVHFSISDRNYQLFRRPGQIIAYRVGGEIRGIDESLVQEPNKPLRPVGKKDLVFPIDETFSVKILDRYNEALDQQVLEVKLKSGHHRHTLTALGADEQLRSFFAGCTPNSAVKRIEAPKDACEEPNPARVKLLRKVNVGLCVFTGVVALPWLFLEVPYRLFSVLALLPTPIAIALYCIFPNDTTLLETKKAERTRASFLRILILSAMVPTLRTFMDFNFLAWTHLLLLSVGVLAALAAVILVFSREWRGHRGLLFTLPFLLAFYAVGFVGQTNYLLDRSDPTEQPAIVAEMKIVTSSKSPDSYHLTVRLPDGSTEELEVDKEFYQQTAIGDAVTVETYTGAFGIPYAFVS